MLLHDVQDIEGKYGFLECKFRTILHGSSPAHTGHAVQRSATPRGFLLVLGPPFDARQLCGVALRGAAGVWPASTTDCTAASARGQTAVKRGRINGGKLILSLVYLSYN